MQTKDITELLAEYAQEVKDFGHVEKSTSYNEILESFSSLSLDRDEFQQMHHRCIDDIKSIFTERDELRLQLADAQAEIKRLQVEVSNRNRRALEGDKAQAAFDLLYTEHEELRIQVEASRKQEPVATYIGACSDGDLIALSDDLRKGAKLYAAPVVADDVQEKYDELIYAVGRKYPNETRHETALHYIKRMEEPATTSTAKCMKGATA